MIQDIAPHNFDIAYRECEPQKDSFVLCFARDSIAIKQQDEIAFPCYGDFDEEIDLTYMFALDKDEYFRYEISEDQIDTFSQKYNLNFVKRGAFRQLKPKELALVGITGMHINGWYLKNKYCGVCACELIHDKKERMLKCPNCNNMVFPRINPAVIVGVIDKDRILLTKYRDREYKKYALIAGFNEVGESLEETVRREVMEEAGVKVKNIRYYKSQPWGFTDNILVGYFCELDGDSEITMDDEELSVAEWVKKGEIPVALEDLSLTNEMICAFMLDNSI